MARIPPLDPDRAAPEAKPLFERDLEHYGFLLNTTQIAAYRPEIALAVQRLGQTMAGSRLIPEQLRLLLNVRVASMVGCPF